MLSRFPARDGFQIGDRNRPRNCLGPEALESTIDKRPLQFDHFEPMVHRLAQACQHPGEQRGEARFSVAKSGDDQLPPWTQNPESLHDRHLPL